jgi:hypothetical protein
MSYQVTIAFLRLSGQYSRDSCRIICHFKKTWGCLTFSLCIIHRQDNVNSKYKVFMIISLNFLQFSRIYHGNSSIFAAT